MVGRPAKKTAHGAPKALRNYGKPKIPVFLMGGEDCTCKSVVQVQMLYDVIFIFKK